MNEKLQSIFIPEAVARLAKDKGFDQWCAGVFIEKYQTAYPNVDGDMNFDFNFHTSFVSPNVFIPAHLQLIEWLLQEHKIYVYMLRNGLWAVENADWKPICDKNRCFMFEINEALELALKQVKR